MIDREKMLAVLDKLNSVDCLMQTTRSYMAVKWTPDEQRTYQDILSLIRTAPEPEDVKRLVEAAKRLLICAEQPGCYVCPIRCPNGMNNPQAEVAAALAEVEKDGGK